MTMLNTHGHAEGCESTEALLTIPDDYFRGLSHLQQLCPDGAEQLIAGLLEDGFSAYRSKVSEVDVMQCIHKEWAVSVNWLHLHTVCASGRIDGMPNSRSAVCGVMRNASDAENLARDFVKWAALDAAVQMNTLV